MRFVAPTWTAAGWARALSTPDVQVIPPPAPPTAREIAEMRIRGIDLARAARDRPVEGPEVPLPPRRDEIDALLQRHGRRVAFGAAVRDAFVLRRDMTFLNHGSFGAAPRVVLEAQRRWQEALESQPVRFMQQQPERVRAVAARLAAFLGASASDLVLVDNATTGVNAVLRSLSLGPGDAIVTTSLVYGAVARTLEHVEATTGARVVTIDVPFPLEDPAQVVEAVARAWPADARLAVLDHITSVTGLVLPIAELVALCHERGVPVLVDAAHAPGQVPVDIDALGADFWVGNAHKWLFAPKGCAVLHVRSEHHERVHPVVISHGYGQGLAAEFEWQGTRDPSPWLAADAALDFVDGFGIDAIRAYDFDLREQGARLLLERLGGEAPAPPEMLAALQTLPIPQDVPGTWEAAWALNRRLWEEHRVEAMFAPCAGRVWVRISAQIYNTLADYERLADVLGALT